MYSNFISKSNVRLVDDNGDSIDLKNGDLTFDKSGLLLLGNNIDGYARPISISSDGYLSISGITTNSSISEIGVIPPSSATYIGASVSTTLPTYLSGQLNAFSLTTSGLLRIDGSNVIQPISATFLPLPSGAATESTLSTLLLDSTFITRINTLGQKTSANSTPVVLASDQSTINVNSIQSGTWTIQPGNTANTTPWLSTISQGGNSATVSASGALKTDSSTVIQPISAASLPLPTGSATETTLSTVLTTSAFQTRINTLGQKTSVNSTPVVLASDQSAIPTSQSGSWTVTANIGTSGSLALDATLTGGLQRTKITDGTNNVVVKAASTAPVASDQALVVVLSPNQAAIPVTSAPSSAVTGVGFGRVQYGGSSGILTAIRATAYVEQTVDFTGSVKSTSANDSSAGTGARIIKITYFDHLGAGPFTENATLNGTTAVNLVNVNHCFIEKMEVLTVGSTGSNAGVISLFAGAGGTGTTVGSIGFGTSSATLGDNETLWAHHYIPSTKLDSLYTIIGGTTGNQTASMHLRASTPLVSNTPETQISDFIVVASGTSSITRLLSNPIKINGFSRVTMYVISNGTNTAFFGAFDYSEV